MFTYQMTKNLIHGVENNFLLFAGLLAKDRCRILMPGRGSMVKCSSALLRAVGSSMNVVKADFYVIVVLFVCQSEVKANFFA